MFFDSYCCVLLLVVIIVVDDDDDDDDDDQCRRHGSAGHGKGGGARLHCLLSVLRDARRRFRGPGDDVVLVLDDPRPEGRHGQLHQAAQSQERHGRHRRLLPQGELRRLPPPAIPAMSSIGECFPQELVRPRSRASPGRPAAGDGRRCARIDVGQPLQRQRALPALPTTLPWSVHHEEEVRS